MLKTDDPNPLFFTQLLLSLHFPRFSMPNSEGNARFGFLKAILKAMLKAIVDRSRDSTHSPPPGHRAVPPPVSQPSIPTYAPKTGHTLCSPPRKPRSASTEDVTFTSSPSEEDAQNYYYRPRLNIWIPPTPPPVYEPSTRPSRMQMPLRRAPSLTSLDSYIENPINSNPVTLEANGCGDAALSSSHAVINMLLFVIFMSIAILGATATLVYLHQDTLEAAKPASLFAFLSSAASFTSGVMAARRLRKWVPSARAARPRSIAEAVPMMFLAFAIIAFIIFFVVVNFTSVQK